MAEVLECSHTHAPPHTLKTPTKLYESTESIVSYLEVIVAVKGEFTGQSVHPRILQLAQEKVFNLLSVIKGLIGKFCI